MTKKIKNFEEETLKLFKKLAPFYDSLFFRYLYFEKVYQKIINIIEKNYIISKNCPFKFLDVACGTGEIIYRLAIKYPLIDFIGVDFSKDMLEQAKIKTKNLKNITLMYANVNNIPLQNEYFDLIICSDALHHFNEPEKSLNEIYRLINKKGVFILADPAVNNIIQKLLFEIFIKIWDKPRKYYSRNELAELLQKNFFKIDQQFTYYLTNFFICSKN